MVIAEKHREQRMGIESHGTLLMLDRAFEHHAR